MRSFVTIIIFLSGFSALAQSFRSIDNQAFMRGEKLAFRIAFNSMLTGNLTAGRATLEVKPENKLFDKRSTFHVVGQGKTTGFIELFYKIDDRLESYFDEKAFTSWQFIRFTRENSYKKDDIVNFRQNEHLAVSLTKRTKTPANIQDIISAFYFARTLDISTLKPGDFVPIPFFLDDSVYQSKMIFKGKETVKTKLGKFRCLALRPMMATGYVFDDPYPITVWVTDDLNRIPILVESELSVGRVRIELTSYSGLVNAVEAEVRKK